MTPGGKNPKIIGTLVLVFLAGAAAGALGMQLGLHERLHRAVAAASVKPARRVAANDALMQRFKTELNLSGEQTEKLAMVLGDYRHYYESLQDQLDDVRSTGKKRILQILDQDQRARFERIMGDLQPQLDKK
ncbi:MAG: hypothetical protein EXQ47_04545 [Bryobacterales bacterium]|nr:hypothetical protein [Bryobacterales bacterium]